MPDRTSSPVLGADIEQIFRAEHGRVVATMARRFGDLDLAEDATSEALVAAVEKWPVDGLPPNPGAWLTTVAGNKALDRIRREAKREGKYAEAAQMNAQLEDDDFDRETGPVSDDRLRLVFTCCHPALAPQHRVALTLRLLGGLTVAEIAKAFLVEETTMAQRITRSKQKIKAAKIPYRVPREQDIAERLSGVLSVLYLIFNEGYLATDSADDPDRSVREELCDEAIRLTRLIQELVAGAPGRPGPLGPEPLPEVDGLLALMLLLDSRRPARVADGRLVTLPDQDRTLWNAEEIDEGHALVRRCLALNRPGPYQYLAAINAVHTDALDASMTDWEQIVQLYDGLYRVSPTQVVALNRAVAVAELDGAEVALAQVDRLDLEGYHAWQATRADLLRRLERYDEAREAYQRAIDLAGNTAEKAWLTHRLDQLPPQR
jgi:RNA polymerase sigma-70 factor (ECF subfamily)